MIQASPELKKICKYWIPFLLKVHKRFGLWNKKELAIGDSSMCMVGEAWKWTNAYVMNCEECRTIALRLDHYSELNRGNTIKPTQINSMIRTGNVFAKHFIKKHGVKK